MNDMIVGVDLAKAVFQLHGATTDGKLVFRKKVPRQQFLRFLATYPGAIIAMEACGSAHFWARELISRNHQVLMIFRLSAILHGVMARAIQGNASNQDAMQVGKRAELLAAIGQRIARGHQPA